MKNNITPIETIYKGYRFRSRLEARWAVFFDKAGIEYKYEPDGFTGIDGDPYLPDFYLPMEEVYAEVKGSNEQLKNDERKILGAIDFNSTPVAKGLIILGEIPNYENFSWGNIPMFPYLWHDKNHVEIEYAAFWEFHILNGKIMLLKGNSDISSTMFRFERGIALAGGKLPSLVSVYEKWTKESMRSFNNEQQSRLIDAYKAARQARFEHGETSVI